MMKKKYAILILLPMVWVPVLSVQAQIKNSEKQDLQQQKISFFTANLKLNATESAQFWPVYNDYQNRRDKITGNRTTMLKYFASNKDNMTEPEAQDMILKYIALQQEETRLLETYTKKFGEFLPAGKVMQIYIVELEFKKWLLQNLRQNKVASPRN